jgi:hypothetical protein
MDTDNLKKKNHKLNSTNQLIFLGQFTPYDLDCIIKNINTERKKILLELKLNSNKLGFEQQEREELNYHISTIETYEDFLNLFNDKNYFLNNKALSNSKKIKFRLTKEMQNKAFKFAKDKINYKKSKFDITPKEEDRHNEKYTKEYISKLERDFNKLETERLSKRKNTFDDFLKSYSKNVNGYRKFLNGTKINNLLKSKFSLFIPTEETKRHTYITGATGSGKSELIKLITYSYILKNLSERKKQKKKNNTANENLENQNNIKNTNKTNNYKLSSTVIIDPHGDISQEIIKFKENTINEDLIYIHPYLDKNYTITINPFETNDKSEQNIDILAQELVNLFKIGYKSTKVPNFP